MLLTYHVSLDPSTGFSITLPHYYSKKSRMAFQENLRTEVSNEETDVEKLAGKQTFRAETFIS
jgi:hypothetical protein